MADAPTCRHPHKRLIAKDKDAEYVECLDCGAIFEAEELGADGAGFNESLADA
jgi:Zn ribbon nucleic-acid-binding protein